MSNIGEKILITINRDIMFEYMNYYFKIHEKAKSFPFASKINEKIYNKDGTPQLTKGGNQKVKSHSRKKSEISKEDLDYLLLSLNEILIIPDRFMMNNLKQQWGNFGLWLADKYNISNRQIENVLIHIIVYSETRAKKDDDNIAGGFKLLSDTLFVKSRALIDDNYTILDPLIISCDYDKDNPRTEIRMTIINNSIKDVNEKMRIHMELWK